MHLSDYNLTIFEHEGRPRILFLIGRRALATLNARTVFAPVAVLQEITPPNPASEASLEWPSQKYARLRKEDSPRHEYGQIANIGIPFDSGTIPLKAYRSRVLDKVYNGDRGISHP